MGAGAIGAPALPANGGRGDTDDQLAAGSIAENIAFGENVYDQQRVEEAARQASVHHEIMALPTGFHSLVRDVESSLSIGQKQRVILARALYRHPRILFLDRGESHPDAGQVLLVDAALRRMKLTCIHIARSPEVIASADRVLVMQAGRIVRTFRQQTRTVGIVAAEPA